MFRSASCCYNIVTAMNQTSRAEKRKEKQKMYTVTFSNEELEEMKPTQTSQAKKSLSS